MGQSKVLITVISDLHCKHTSSDKDQTGKLIARSTNLYSDLLRTESSPKHPVYNLLQEIDKSQSSFKSDILLCPGDITDKADLQGYITGWSFLEEIKEVIDAKELLATVGNHDVDSRRKNPNDKPFHISRSIKWNYPIENKELNSDFWNDHFCILESDHYVILVFNSSHSHISSSDASKSYIDENILIKMDAKLRVVGSGKINIALCHHHPISHSNLSYPDSDVIDKGEKFLELLCKHNFTILIHGHKHEMKIRYYNSLVVFCAGSFSSRENIEETESDNAFHVLEVNNNKTGIIRTWIYGTHTGWQHKNGKIFPAICGFGYKGDINKLASDINDWFNNSSNGYNDLYLNLVKDIPEIQYLLPEESKSLNEKLLDFQIDITYDSLGIPKKISKLITQ